MLKCSGAYPNKWEVYLEALDGDVVRPGKPQPLIKRQTLWETSQCCKTSEDIWGPWSHISVGIEWHLRSSLQCVGLWRLLYGSRKPLPEEILQDPCSQKCAWNNPQAFARSDFKLSEVFLGWAVILKPWWVCDCAQGNRQIRGGRTASQTQIKWYPAMQRWFAGLIHFATLPINTRRTSDQRNRSKVRDSEGIVT